MKAACWLRSHACHVPRTWPPPLVRWPSSNPALHRKGHAMIITQTQIALAVVLAGIHGVTAQFNLGGGFQSDKCSMVCPLFHPAGKRRSSRVLMCCPRRRPRSSKK
jgi:hypothetical protein